MKSASPAAPTSHISVFQDSSIRRVWHNGDHNTPAVPTQTAEEGGATRVLKLRQIEPELFERMLSVEDV